MDATISELNDAAERAGLDLLQLHGSEPPDILPHLKRPVLKALSPPLGTPLSSVVEQIEQYQAVENTPIAYLIDGYAADQAGGTGTRADWQLAAGLARDWPVVLAGGLQPENVAAAIRTVRPLAVDVSSGVESANWKDRSKIASFIDEARQAFALESAPDPT